MSSDLDELRQSVNVKEKRGGQGNINQTLMNVEPNLNFNVPNIKYLLTRLFCANVL